MIAPADWSEHGPRSTRGAAGSAEQPTRRDLRWTDTLTVGEATTPQSRGKVIPHFHRVGASVGMIIHDLDGNERGGMSWLSNGRGVIAFDYPERDAIGMYVDDTNRSAHFILENPDEAVGDVSLLELSAQGKGGEVRLYDATGKVRTRWSIADGRLEPAARP